jgi:hypothetical protein
MPSLNNIKGTTKEYSDLGASFATLIDLGTEYSYNTIMIVNSLDASFVLKVGSNEIILPANKDLVIDNVIFNSIIQYKYSSAPSSGSLTIICS